MISSFLYSIAEPSMPLTVYKVLIYDECSEQKIDVTDSFNKGKAFEHSYEDFRIEYRYWWNSQKYRYISYQPFTKPFIDLEHLYKKKSFKQRIIAASLKRSSMFYDENILDDVLKKVKKYAGPQGDFFKNQFKPKWFFPSEDFNDDEILTTMTSHGQVETINMSDNNLIRII
jgi:hypothetical protein